MHLVVYLAGDKHHEMDVMNLQKGDKRHREYCKDEKLGYVMYGISYLTI